MIITIVNYTSRSSRITLLVLSLFGLTACAPIALPRLPIPIQLPQGYPVQLPYANVPTPQQRPQPVTQNTQQSSRAIPKAGALISAPVKIARAPVPVVPQQPQRLQQRVQQVPARTAQRQFQQVSVPPVLNPVQQARANNAVRPGKPGNNYRPLACLLYTSPSPRDS